ncbi:MAG: relaxase domain-containing protein, partial [Acidipropionibacterium sp.]|nr:relaxase domain-containing protein [Acidipropionibacterium sp.]
PKSASVLWAVADAGTQSLIAQAHHDAVADMIAYMEREVAATRTGTTAGDGAVAQVDVRGVIATAYDHYDSRAGDPHLHTHVVISNKVQTVLDGKWRSSGQSPDARRDRRALGAARGRLCRPPDTDARG